MSAESFPDSTVEGLQHHPRGSSGRWAHRAGVTFVALLVAGGLTGFFGPRTEQTASSGGGYDLTVEYPAVTRAGEPAPLHLRVENPDGFDGPVELELCNSWFDDYDFQSWYPTPSKETAEPEVIAYEFDPPAGTALDVSLDARASPGELWSTDACTISVLDGGAPATSVEFTSWRMP